MCCSLQLLPLLSQLTSILSRLDDFFGQDSLRPLEHPHLKASKTSLMDGRSAGSASMHLSIKLLILSGQSAGTLSSLQTRDLSHDDRAVKWPSTDINKHRLVQELQIKDWVQSQQSPKLLPAWSNIFMHSSLASISRLQPCAEYVPQVTSAWSFMGADFPQQDLQFSIYPESFRVYMYKAMLGLMWLIQDESHLISVVSALFKGLMQIYLLHVRLTWSAT